MGRVRFRYSEEGLNRLVSHLPGVKGVVAGEADVRGARAKAKLAARRYDGHSQIDVIHADVDSYVVLSDERGQQAAAAIEYGRRPYIREIPTKGGGVRKVKIGGTKGVGALKAAMS